MIQTHYRLDLKSHTDKSNSSIYQEPEVSLSVLAKIPDTLRLLLEDQVRNRRHAKLSLLISSNSLANKFILSKWGIRPPQRRRYKNLFVLIRRQCRLIFQHLAKNGIFEWTKNGMKFTFGIFKYDEVRGNLILGFVQIPPDSEWTLPMR